MVTLRKLGLIPGKGWHILVSIASWFGSGCSSSFLLKRYRGPFLWGVRWLGCEADTHLKTVLKLILYPDMSSLTIRLYSVVLELNVRYDVQRPEFELYLHQEASKWLPSILDVPCQRVNYRILPLPVWEIFIRVG